jgi:hypothetical protein
LERLDFDCVFGRDRLADETRAGLVVNLVTDQCSQARARNREIHRRLQSWEHQAIKTLMRWTGANERTTKNWLSRANGPSGEHLLEIMRHSDLVFECVLELVDRKVTLSHRKLEEVHDALQATAQRLSEMIQSKDLPRSH